MAKTKPGQRVVLQLDPRIALEAIILNRLERIPVARRQEWLRGLLVQGFRSECQALRGVAEERARPPAAAFTQWLVAGSQSLEAGKSPKVEPLVAVVVPAKERGAAKPFASLGKVIG